LNELIDKVEPVEDLILFKVIDKVDLRMESLGSLKVRILSILLNFGQGSLNLGCAEGLLVDNDLV